MEAQLYGAGTPQGATQRLTATVTRFLRGIKNKTIAVDVGEWTRALIDDLSAYVERERGARETLEQLFRAR